MKSKSQKIEIQVLYKVSVSAYNTDLAQVTIRIFSYIVVFVSTHLNFIMYLIIKETNDNFHIFNSALESFRKKEVLSNLAASNLTVDEVRKPQFHILLKVYT